MLKKVGIRTADTHFHCRSCLRSVLNACRAQRTYPFHLCSPAQYAI